MTQGHEDLFHTSRFITGIIRQICAKNTVYVIIYGILWDETSAYRVLGCTTLLRSAPSRND